MAAIASLAVGGVAALAGTVAAAEGGSVMPWLPTGKSPAQLRSRERTERYEAERGTAHARGYTARWSRASRAFLREHPLCVDCEEQGRLTPATQVHHVRKVADYPELFWMESNWRGLCESCHSKRTARGE